MQATGPKQVQHLWLLPLMTAGFIAGMLPGRTAPTWLCGAAILLLCSGAAMLLKGRMRIVALVMAAAGLGAWMSFIAYHPDRPAEDEYLVSGVIVQAVQVEPDGQVKTVLDHVTLNGQPAGVKAYWSWYKKHPADPLPSGFKPGAWVDFSGRLYHPEGAVNPGGFDFNDYLLQRGITFGLYDADGLLVGMGTDTVSGWLAALRHHLTLKLMDAMGTESGAYAAAVLLGSRDYMPDEDVEAFRRLGIAHIISVSGWHVGILMMLLGLLMAPLHLPRVTGLLIKAALLAGYAALTGGNAPVIRASLLLLFLEYGKLHHQRNSAMHLVCLSAVLQLIVSPAQLFGASFQLTYSAMLGILLVRPWLLRRFRPVSPVRARLWEVFAASLAAQLGILPVELYWFASLPVMTLVMNVFTVGLMSVVMLLFWATLFLLPVPWLGELFASLTGWLTTAMLSGLRALANAAGMMLWTKQGNWLTLLGCMLLLTGMSILLKYRWKKSRKWLCLAGTLLFVASLIPLPHRGTEWMQFSVGEADAALLWDDDYVVVVDAGEEANDLHYFLRDHRLSVDLLILTHLHNDHAGGVGHFIDMGIPVKRCLLPVDAAVPADVDSGLSESIGRMAEAGTEISMISRGDEIRLPHGTFTVLWPQSGAVRQAMSANDASLTLHADLLGTSMLLTGDLSGVYEMYCAVPADVLKAAHHGSTDSTSPAFLAAVGPQAILLSCGKEQREASMWERSGDIALYSTASQGAITLRFTESSFTVETFLNGNTFDAP